MTAQPATPTKKGASGFSPSAPVVAGALNVPSAFVIPFRFHLDHAAA